MYILMLQMGQTAVIHIVGESLGQAYKYNKFNYVYKNILLDGACCTSKTPCDLYGGDCDRDTDCAGNLVCGLDNCRQFDPTAGSQS